jgi:DNA-binding FadR family transcriptional regulator
MTTYEIHDHVTTYEMHDHVTTVFSNLSSRRNLSGSVADRIEERILLGVLAPGERLPSEVELGRQFGVSRSVIRDASQALAARGLVSIRQGVGVTVTAPDSGGFADAAFLVLMRGDATVRDALEARLEIEVMVAGVAAERRRDEDVTRLRERLAVLIDAAGRESMVAVREADLALHGEILTATRMTVLTAMLGPLGQVIQRTSMTPLVTTRAFDLDRHVDVVEAIAAGDAERARGAMRDHFLFMEDPIYAAIHVQLLRDVPTLMEIREEMQHERG